MGVWFCQPQQYAEKKGGGSEWGLHEGKVKLRIELQ